MKKEANRRRAAKERIYLRANESLDSRSNRTRVTSALSLLFLLSGLMGLLLVLNSIRGITLGVAVYWTSVGLCALLWVAWRRGCKVFWIVFGAALTAVLLLIYAWREVLPEQFLFLIESLRGLVPEDTEPVNLQQAGIVAGCTIAVVMFCMECLLSAHVPLYILTTAVLAVSPLVAVQVTASSLLLLIVFQISFWAMFNERKRDDKHNLVLPRQHAVTSHGSWMAACAVILCFALVNPLLSRHATAMYDTANELEGHVSRSVQKALGTQEESITEGQVSRGNHFRSGNAKLHLETTGPITQTLYLRGFKGGEYVGGEWVAASDEDLFSQMEDVLQWGHWNYWIAPMFKEQYFNLNERMLYAPVPNSIYLAISHIGTDHDSAYVPYYSRKDGGWSYDEPDTKPSETGWRYSFHYYEAPDMHVDWNNIQPSYSMQMGWYYAIERAYMYVSAQPFTHVAADTVPRLRAFVEEHPQEDLDGITAFILYTLQNGAEYNLTPGWAPVNDDIVDYFLFERGSGYCVHFASAATLMYRMYGVPARYAAGYAVPASAFEETEHGTYTADVTDEYAHAWTEIYLPAYGWTPIEVTPNAAGSMTASYPGFDAMDFSRTVSEQGWTLQTLGLFDQQNAQSSTVSDPTDGFFASTTSLTKVDSSNAQGNLLLWLLCILAVVCLTPVILEYCRLRKLCARPDLTNRQLFGQFMDLLHYCGQLPDYDGTEPDFTTHLCASIPEISRQDAQSIMQQVLRAAYGPETANEKEDNSVLLGALRNAADSLTKGLSRVKYWVGKYIRRLF